MSEIDTYESIPDQNRGKSAPIARKSAAQLLDSTVTELKAQLAVLKRARLRLRHDAAGWDKGMAYAAASLAKAITSASAELRQQDKHVKDLVDAMSPEETQELIRDWIAEQGAPLQQELYAWLGQLIQREMILS